MVHILVGWLVVLFYRCILTLHSSILACGACTGIYLSSSGEKGGYKAEAEN